MNWGQIATILGLAGTLAGGVYFMEDRYQKITDSVCQVEKNNKYIEHNINTLRIEIHTNNLMSADGIDQQAIINDIKTLQDRQTILSTEMNQQC